MPRRLILTTLALFAVWLALTASLDPQELTAGALASLIAAILSVRHLALLDDIKLTPLLPLHLLHYYLILFRAILRSSLDVARRVLSPSQPIAPAVVAVHTELRSALGRFWLANSITLTPGTLTVDIDGDRLTVHWIDAPAGEDLERATRAIVAEFEAPLKELLR
jgi:multicomponent Na+:H+ antiporter subunit E